MEICLGVTGKICWSGSPSLVGCVARSSGLVLCASVFFVVQNKKKMGKERTTLTGEENVEGGARGKCPGCPAGYVAHGQLYVLTVCCVFFISPFFGGLGLRSAHDHMLAQQGASWNGINFVILSRLQIGGRMSIFRPHEWQVLLVIRDESPHFLHDQFFYRVIYVDSVN